MNRELLITLGWTPPPDPPEYEKWRPALEFYRKSYDGPSVASPMDNIDRETVDMLRAVVKLTPKE